MDCASHGGGDLAPLLRALLPGGAAPLRTLRLWSCWLDAPRCGPLPELAGLRSLVIAAAPGAELLPPSLVHSLLEQAPGLESLEVYGVEEEEAPLPAVAQLRRLTRLEWNGRRAALPGQPAPRCARGTLLAAAPFAAVLFAALLLLRLVLLMRCCSCAAFSRQPAGLRALPPPRSPLPAAAAAARTGWLARLTSVWALLGRRPAHAPLLFPHHLAAEPIPGLQSCG